MKRCLILFEIEFTDADSEPYESRHHLTLGPFRSKQNAGFFMTEYLENEEKIISMIQPNYDRKISHLVRWEVVDLMTEEEAIANICEI